MPEKLLLGILLLGPALLLAVVVGGVVLASANGGVAALPSPGSYTNAESWDITWSPEGLPLKIEVHRDARRG